MSDKRAFEALEPCPFCGPGESVVEVYEGEYKPGWRVGCGRCGSHSGHHWTREQAVAAWNCRAPLDAAGREGQQEQYCDACYGPKGDCGCAIGYADAIAERRALAEGPRAWLVEHTDGSHSLFFTREEIEESELSVKTSTPLVAHPAPKAVEAADWVCVPREPTEAMQVAGRKKLAEVCDRFDEARNTARSSIEFWQIVGHHPADDIWNAMLAASPARVGEGAVYEALAEAEKALAFYESLPKDQWPGPPTTALALIRAAMSREAQG